MTLSLITCSFFSLFSALLFSSSPLNLGLWIIVIAITIATTMSFISASWFGLLLFIIYVGGLLVIFAYFVAISPNQEINFINIILTFLGTFALTLTISTSFLPIKQLPTIYHTNPYIALFFYSSKNVLPLILMALALLVALIAVVKVSNRGNGPLRPFLSEDSLIKQ